MAAPAPQVEHGDPCGAGDRFASSLALALVRGMTLDAAVVAAVASASAFVSGGGAEAALCSARPEMGGPASGLDAVERVRAAGGTVVPPGAASTCCTLATCARWRPPAASATPWSYASTRTTRCGA